MVTPKGIKPHHHVKVIPWCGKYKNMAIDGIYRKNNNAKYNNKDNKHAKTYQRWAKWGRLNGNELELNDVKERRSVEKFGGKSPQYIPRVPRELIEVCPD